MSELRLSFVDWQPDLEDEVNQGLTVADNVLHGIDGYKPSHLGSAGSFATTGGLAASNATVVSIIAKPVGAQDDVLCAWVTNSGGLNIGINGVTGTSTSTGYPLSFATAVGGKIQAFDVCELAGQVFFVVEATQQTISPATVVSLRHTGYFGY